MRNTLTMALLWAVSHLYAQWSEDFSHPLDSTWSGSLQSFQINSNEKLQLQASQSGEASLWHSASIFSEMEWNFDFGLDFSPSSSNKLVFFLLADSSDVQSKQALTLEIGESGNGDRWRIYWREGTNKTLWAEGTVGQFATGPLEFKCSLRYDKGGSWNVKMENKNGELTSSTFYQVIPISNPQFFFGLNCIFTETRKTAFYFDNFYVGPTVADVSPPSILRISKALPNQLIIRFNEEIDTLKSNMHMHITLEKFQSVLLRHWITKAELQLDFASELPVNEELKLHCDSVYDLAGNAMHDTIEIFYLDQKFAPSYLEVLISEIFPDPTPQRFLPEKEYVELYNRSGKTLNLSNCHFSDLSSQFAFPNIHLDPYSYLILCDQSDTSVFSQYGKVLGIKNFLSLNNSGDLLSLRDSNGVLIHQLRYNLGNYGDPLKSEGGYSLELTGIQDVCNLSTLLLASKDPQGGTPGVQNSWYIEKVDSSGPVLTDVYATSEWEIIAVFDEELNPQIPYHAELFSIFPSRSIATVDFEAESYNKLVLLLNEPLVPGLQYQLMMHAVEDCMGNPIEIVSMDFGLPEQPEKGDLVLSEVLFNPLPSHHDFVEVYNRSQKFLDLSNLYLKNPVANSILYPVHSKRSLAPFGYLACTQEPEDLINTYSHGIFTNVFMMEIPPLEDEGGCLVLGVMKKSQLFTLDSFCFLNTWHHPVLEETEGVSLEKVNMFLPSDAKSSWQSAAKDFGYATPGAPNSQVLNTGPGISQRPYTLSTHAIFVGDLTEKGALRIEFNVQETSYSCRLALFDLSGHFLALLHDGRIRQDEILQWYGESIGSFFGQAGNYILQIQFMHPFRKTQVFNERLTVIR